MMNHDHALREFHVSRQARETYKFDESLFTLSGNVIFANFHAARLFAQKMNEKRDLINFPERAVRAGQINAMGLIDEILHAVVREYCEQCKPTALAEALAYVEAELGADRVEVALRAFTEQFPPLAVHRREMTVAEYLAGATGDTPHRQVALEELLMLWLANDNPAFAPFLELFDDSDLEKFTAYTQVIARLDDFFRTQPPFGPDHQPLIEMLRTPARKFPHSLEAQLEFIRTHWAPLLGKYLYRVLSSLDLLAEEQKPFFGFGPGPVKPYEFAGLEVEPERFSPDSAWMPRLVLIAKNTYVWLDQLSKKYQRPIVHLDQVPDEELDTLARWGMSGLWLIGLWQRSTASQRIKQMMGNPEAVASAYSLEDYRIADDLGGEAAYEDLKARAWRRGIRMASDMVPNHMGIDSTWVMEHPDWFISLPYSPFPTYTFNGPNLSHNPRVGIYLEDHYYNRTDAAVVFKRVDHWTGDTRYIYHGNDGTSMPWNDTAQLNYLKPEVREAVIQTILHVARRSPVIRFDAAMTLTKKHYQRLWFPEPGTGGDIASRADFGMTKAEFDAAMPQEFWREVVDRVAQEAPDTLLLAEAFWLMEGYFVRTLGMHRVYNSAFMNMMRDEKNAEYRQLIKNTLDFDPQILKRYVNFMNNPDERTAVDQFGKGDKYFGICTVMATLPGLPMFGHGQVEGYAEKYGMEFRRAYWDEVPDAYMVQRHERQIFPLLHRRALFAEVEHFRLYDFVTPEGYVDENVFAYSNRMGHERSLVLYHNRYAETRGWARMSVAYVVKDETGDKKLVQQSLAEGLQIPNDPDVYLIFRDAVSGLEYIRNCRELVENGLYAELHAYQVHVFLDFREVRDNEWRQYAQLTAYLNGRGVASIDETLKELFLAPVHAPFRMLVSAPAFRWLLTARITDPETVPDENILSQVRQKMLDLLNAVKAVAQAEGEAAPVADEVCAKLETILSLPLILDKLAPAPADETYQAATAYVLKAWKMAAPVTWGTLFGWLFTHALGKVVDVETADEISRSWLDEWLFGKLIIGALEDWGLEEGAARRATALIKLLLGYRRWFEEVDETDNPAYHVLYAMLREQDVQAYLGVNRYQDILWFNQESFELWAEWIMLLSTVELATEAGEDFAEAFTSRYALVQQWLEAEKASGFQVVKLLEALKTPQGGRLNV
ncbi:MAG TPA: alpha-amylase family glycosyl hydrolase [Anaerolineae bacterium]|nr:alpha-amylase family glycosyl hydrolase [Anaerolineae bacterium]HQK14928.1 alpha-amylase family glycosyl hydrolase [Anaerolineae bacterium]